MNRATAPEPLSVDIDDLTRGNEFFRKELVTARHSQVVLMCIPPGEEIGEETHEVDQILVFLGGSGESHLNGVSQRVRANTLVLVPAGTRHNFVNTGGEPLKLFTIYAPPEEEPGTLHRNKAEAQAAEHAKAER
jgi:mannose-6-phosphate isomerase-like protein (cupin superfamily)